VCPETANPGLAACRQEVEKLGTRLGGTVSCDAGAPQNGPRIPGEATFGDMREGADGVRTLPLAFALPTRQGSADASIVISFAIDPMRLTEMLRQQDLPADWAVSVTDRRGIVVARNVAATGAIGDLMPAMRRAALAESARGVLPVRFTPEGAKVTTAFAHAEHSGYVVTLGGTLPVAGARLLAIGALVLAAGLLAGVLLAPRLARLVRRPGRGSLQWTRPRRLGRLAAGLEEAQGRSRILYDAVPLGVMVVEPDSLALLDCNDRACDMLGNFPAQAPSLPASGLDADIGARLRAIATTPHGEVFETRLLRGDGPSVDLQVTARRLVLREGTLVMALLQDVTERNAVVAALAESQAELRDLNMTLEQRVREEVAAREEAQAHLLQAQKMQALGQLAGGIAHDFNNVLHMVIGMAELTDQRAEDPVMVRRHSGRIIRAANRGASITSRLLNFARKAELRTERVDVAAMLAGVREIVGSTLGTTMDIVVRDRDGLPPALADASQLETVLVNLAVNARDAMPGGGTFILSAVARSVAPDDAAAVGVLPGRYVRIVATDTGSGMDAATLARATEPFFTTKGPGQGTGLGLAMARGFAEQSGGTLQIESTPGKGTAVSLWLPAADTQMTAAPLTSVGPPRVLDVRVLVVDDDPMVRETTTAQLEAAGLNVTSTSDPLEALALLDHDETVAALVTDLAMPVMNGLMLIRAAQERRPALPALLITGNTATGDAAALAVTGVASRSFSLLRKPVTSQHLIEAISALLRSAADRSTSTGASTTPSPAERLQAAE
jgi:signal transduction histidine kinase/FixJ family two-component response regulator